MKKLLWLLLPLILAGCSAKIVNTPAVTTKLACGPGPEDMEMLYTPTDTVMFISCAQRRKNVGDSLYANFGEIMLYSFDGKPPVVVERSGGPTGTGFSPHGISVRQSGNRAFLYVVNHGKLIGQKKRSNTIEMYEWGGYNLVHVKTYSGKGLYSPNDCFALDNGTILFTNDSGKRGIAFEKVFRLPKSNLCIIDQYDTIRTVMPKLAYANGIYAEKIGNANFKMMPETEGIDLSSHKLYVSTVQQKAMYTANLPQNVADYTPLKQRTNIFKAYGQDNIMPYGNSKLLVACHPKPLKFIAHVGNPKKKSPTVVYEVDKLTGQSKVLFTDDGGRISTGSTALVHNNKLYISQVFQPYILVVDLPTP